MKLLILLRSLQPDEYKVFEWFLQSPYFKNSSKYLQFFRFLVKHFPGFSLPKNQIKEAFKQCVGDADFSETKYYNMVSGLSRQLEHFLVAQRVFEHDPTTYLKLLTFSLGDRNLGAYFRSESQQFIQQLESTAIKTQNDYLTICQTHKQLYFNPDTPKFGNYASHLQQAADYLDMYYALAKMRLSAEMKVRERILNARFETPLLDHVLEWSRHEKIAENAPLITLYRTTIELYRDGMTAEGFQALKNLFTQHFSQLPAQEQVILVRHLINGGISLVARDVPVEKELLDLYKLALGSEALFEHNRMTVVTFVNISNLAGLCHDYNWAFSFIDKYAIYLEAEKQPAAVFLAKAGLLFHQKKLDEAQTTLNTVPFSTAPFDLLGRNLLLKIAVDRFLNYSDGLDFLNAHLKAYERYVNVKPFADDRKSAELNLIRFTRKLIATKLDFGKVNELKKTELKAKLAAYPLVVSKKWLESKIDEL
ncbi:MAG: hypothetical protein JNJ57_20665 [Saprospiraceae bacterium]|nr:hypothetical protein [Saprospiraceae bacterium]